jgi:hypothetical protein
MTKTTRRTFLKTSAGAACAAPGGSHVSTLQRSGPDKAALDRILAEPVLPCTLHLSEFGFAYLNILHFASYVADPGPFQEFKGETGIPFTCDTSPLTCKNGNVRCPSGPGFGIKVDPDFVRKFQPVKDV